MITASFLSRLRNNDVRTAREPRGTIFACRGCQLARGLVRCWSRRPVRGSGAGW